MVYAKQNFIDDQVLFADMLNKMDDGIIEFQYLKHYGDTNIVPSVDNLFTFIIDNETMTASVCAANSDISGNIVIPYFYEIDGEVYEVTTITGNAFSDCIAIEEITIPTSITKIGHSVFDGCENLIAIYYGGTTEQWDKITIEENNSSLESLIQLKTYDSVVSKGEGDFSIVAGKDCRAISDYSSAIGYNNIAGLKAYYIKSIDITNKKIYLSNTQLTPIISEDDNRDIDFETPGYEVGDIFDLIIKYSETSRMHYHFVGSIVSIVNNMIEYDTTLPFTEVHEDTAAVYSQTFFVPSKPNIGILDIGGSSDASGESNVAAGKWSHSEGYGNISAGRFSHTEGLQNKASYTAHAEGYTTIASGVSSHAEGQQSTASGEVSHAEGYRTTASGEKSHAEGYRTTASGASSHSEGFVTIASGEKSHAEGHRTTASGEASHAEGMSTIAGSNYQHVQGKYNVKDTANTYAHIVGNGEDETKRSNAHTLDWSGNACYAGDVYANGADKSTGKKLATEEYVSDSVKDIKAGVGAVGDVANAEIFNDYVNNIASAAYSHAEGYTTTATGSYSHAEGRQTVASAYISHAEGYITSASNQYAHAEGHQSAASGDASHAEGFRTTASGEKSHAEGYRTTASGASSHSQGYITAASGEKSHAEGHRTTASGEGSHAEGNTTIAASNYQHVQGKYNVKDTANTYAHIVGNGEGADDRSNAHTLDWSGNACYAGDVYANGANKSTGKKLATEEYVSNAIKNIEIGTDTPTIDLTNITTMINNLHYYCNKDIVYDKNLFNISSNELSIDCSKITDGKLVIPYDLETHTSVSVIDPEVITKIIIPRGMNLVNEQIMTDEDLVAIFTNLNVIVRIHEDGAVLSYNIAESAMN